MLVWAHYSETPLRRLGLGPLPRIAPALLGFVLGIVLKLVVKSIAMPLLGAPALNSTYHHVVKNAAALPWLIASALISASVCEEIFFRGYLFERLRALWGTGPLALSGTLVLSTVLFALAHYPDQGVPGAEQAVMTGAALGGLYAWRKELWLPVVVHAGYDLAAIAIIYFGWEQAVARLVFH